MTLTELSTALQTIVAGIPNALFLRATDTDANKSVDNIDLSGKTIVLFNNLPTIVHNVARSGFIMQEIPVEIKVLQLAQLDNTTGQQDTIRDNCTAIANSIFDLITKDQQLPDAFEYSIAYLGAVNIYDKLLTGCAFSFVMNSSRSSYEC